MFFITSRQVCRDPRWGRSYESFGEDTDIVRNMTSIVTGLQGQPPEGHLKGYPFLAGRSVKLTIVHISFGPLKPKEIAFLIHF